MSEKELKALDFEEENVSGGFYSSYDESPEWILLDGEAKFKKRVLHKGEKRVDKHKEIGRYRTRKEAEEAARQRGLSLKAVVLDDKYC